MLSALAGNVLFRIALGDFTQTQHEAAVQGVDAQRVCDVLYRLRNCGLALCRSGLWSATHKGVNALFDGDAFEYEPNPCLDDAAEDARVLREARKALKRDSTWAAGREGVFDALLVGGFRASEAWPVARSGPGIHDAAPWPGMLDGVLSAARDQAYANRFARRFAGLTREEWETAEAESTEEEREALARICQRRLDEIEATS